MGFLVATGAENGHSKKMMNQQHVLSMIKEQQYELNKRKSNNFFTKYFMVSFQQYVIKEISKLYPTNAFGNKHLGKTKFNIQSDKYGRDRYDVHELPIKNKYKLIGYSNGKSKYTY